jgi:hypothetical protein
MFKLTKTLVTLITLISINSYCSQQEMKEGENAIAFLLRTKNFHLPKSYEGDPSLMSINPNDLTPDMFKPKIGLAMWKKKSYHASTGEVYPAFGDQSIFLRGFSYYSPGSDAFKKFLEGKGHELYLPEEDCFIFFPGNPELSLKFEVVQKIRDDYYNK